MASFLQTLIPLLSSTALLLALATWPARGQTTSFTYDFYGSQPNDLTYQGDAHFSSDSTYLRLISTDASGNPLPKSAGRVLYTAPIQFWEEGAQVDLETTLKFIIKPNEGDTDPGDGLTFFIAPVGSAIGAAGGSFGIFDDSGKKPGVFAVEFDIYINSAVDPSYRHVGIDIESQVSSNVTEVGDAILGQEVTARIDYEEATKVISVHVTAGSKTFEVSYVYDLSTVLDQQVQVGISASTGGKVATFEVISWYFTSTLVHTTANSKEAGGNIRQVV
ncbi:hypothetical protein C2S53_013509 [Perilla frutescens var. hirtella]|uniref:Legume lectin domain-containing protein n=1 Tax=Perilla frutescens var. hirtella TaxID=608512 RepID=A0AAD4P7R1_PERFH|nr:hypothetical protein C2S53_013509 [Perilla frutescens var. hirtella]